MFDMGWAEIFVIVVVALIVIGPDKLPEVARGLAKLIRAIQRMVSDVKNSVLLEELETYTNPMDHGPTPSDPQPPKKPTPDQTKDLRRKERTH
ncbi:Sec-independent protein translocase protein TatB [Magnetococcales bacterium HHB-1]